MRFFPELSRVLVAFLLLGAWGNCESGWASVSPEVESAAEASNRFAFSLFRSVERRTRRGNKFLSPLSTYFMLSLLHHGAEGNTRTEIGNALGLTSSRWDRNVANADLLTHLSVSRPDFALSIGNSLWARQGVSFKAPFAEVARTRYRAPATTIDFASVRAVAAMNEWISSQTGGRIRASLRGPLSGATNLVALSASHFRADWKIPFKARHTRLSPFEGEGEDVPTLFGEMSIRHATFPLGEAIELPYGRTGAASLVIVMPKNPQAFEASLDEFTWAGISEALAASRRDRVLVGLPKLELSYESALSPALAKLGMPEAFTSHADFSNLSDSKTWISEVIGQTFLSLDEKGTEASSATSFTITSEPPPLMHRFIVDKPYVIALRDDASGALLFLGSIRRPEGGKLPPPPLQD